jgi:uncharacterized membrane protein
MIKLSLILPIIFLVGCSTTVPVKRNFPEVPPELMKTCPALKTVEQDTKQLSKILSVVTDNYAQYHECKIKVDSWIEWYNAQKEIFEEVK